MADYLFRREGRYSYRRRYPTNVAKLLGRTEFVQALGTADRSDAIKLAHKVSVQFDEACARALTAPSEGPATPPPAQSATHPSSYLTGRSESVVAALPALIRQLTLSIVAEQGANPRGWKDGLAWRKQGLAAHVNGEMPREFQMHPLHAQAALRTIERIEAGEIDLHEFDQRSALGSAYSTTASTTPEILHRLTQTDFEIAFAEYTRGKGPRRILVARRCADRCLTLPCTQQEAIAGITKWSAQALANGTKASAVWTEASAVEALLKYVPGWSNFKVPKTGELLPLKGAGKASKDARQPMSVPVLRNVLLDVDKHLPRNGEHWKAALVLCALYGLRPGELLGATPDSLKELEDVMGATQLAFRVGLNGAKNESSKRNLPVPQHLEPIFRTALRLGACSPNSVSTRVERLNKILRNTLAGKHAELSLYSLRHTFADVARGCGYTEAQFGPLMGHKGASGMTGIYGGKTELSVNAELLAKIERRMFPEGLATYFPSNPT